MRNIPSGSIHSHSFNQLFPDVWSSPSVSILLVSSREGQFWPPYIKICLHPPEPTTLPRKSVLHPSYSIFLPSTCSAFFFFNLLFPGVTSGKEPTANTGDEMRVWSLGQEDPLEEGMATHSSILVWRIPWTEEPGGLQSRGSQRVRHDWATNTLTLMMYNIYFFAYHLSSPSNVRSMKVGQFGLFCSLLPMLN